MQYELSCDVRCFPASAIRRGGCGVWRRCFCARSRSATVVGPQRQRAICRSPPNSAESECGSPLCPAHTVVESSAETVGLRAPFAGHHHPPMPARAGTERREALKGSTDAIHTEHHRRHIRPSTLLLHSAFTFASSSRVFVRSSSSPLVSSTRLPFCAPSSLPSPLTPRHARSVQARQLLHFLSPQRLRARARQGEAQQQQRSRILLL